MTQQFGPFLDALPFGEKWYERRIERFYDSTEQLWDHLGLVLGRVNPTGSMSPMLVGGELLLLDTCPKNIRVGDIVAFMRDGRATTHRITQIEEIDGKKRYHTKGDSAKQDKGFRTLEEIGARLIRVFRPPLLGKYLRSDYFWRRGKWWIKPKPEVIDN